MGVISVWQDPAHDLAGNMTQMPQPATPTSRFYDLTYDAWNRLVTVYDDHESQNAQENEYDGLGRRIVRVDVAAGTTYDCYYNESWQLLEERKGGDPDPLNQFLWHPYYVDALAVRWYDATVGGTQTDYYYQHDANFNVTAVTNSSGAVQIRCKYTPYGKVTLLNSTFGTTAIPSIGNTHFYTGRELDAETGLQLNRHRFYANLLGRWATRDPILYDGGVNLYGYVGGMPTFYADPNGMDPVDGGYGYGGPGRKPPKWPPTINPEGPSFGTPEAHPGGKNCNIWGEGEAPGFDDYGSAGPDFDRYNDGRPSTQTIGDGCCDVIAVRSSPVIPETWDEMIRICKADCTITISQPCKVIGKTYDEAITALKKNGCKKRQTTLPKPTPGPQAGFPTCVFSVRPGECGDRPKCEDCGKKK